MLKGEKQILVTCHPHLKGKNISRDTTSRVDVHYGKYLPSQSGNFKEEPVVTSVLPRARSKPSKEPKRVLDSVCVSRLHEDKGICHH